MMDGWMEIVDGLMDIIIKTYRSFTPGAIIQVWRWHFMVQVALRVNQLEFEYVHW